MSDRIERQCFVCKDGIDESNSLDPCGVLIYSNCNKDCSKQREQTFFCHFECFKKINKDDSSIYLESIPTPEDAEIEFESDNSLMTSFAEDFQNELYRRGSFLSGALQSIPQGTWIQVTEIVNNFPNLMKKANLFEEKAMFPIILTKLSDFYDGKRGNKKSYCILLAAEPDYAHPTVVIAFNN